MVELAKVLTPENREDVLPRFFHLSKSGAKAISAALRPDEAAPRRDVITAVRAPVAAATLPLSGRAAVEPAPEPPFHLDEVPRANSRSEPMPPASPPRPGIEPLTAELSRLHVTVSREFLAKLEAARAALSHSHPGASAQDVLEAGLDLLMERHDKRRGLVEKPRREPRACEAGPRAGAREAGGLEAGRRSVPMAGDGGGVCGSIHQVELDHVVPRGRGGPPTIENTRCLCRVHNQYAARQVYGDEWMDRFTRTAVPASSDDDAAAAAPP